MPTSCRNFDCASFVGWVSRPVRTFFSVGWVSRPVRPQTNPLLVGLTLSLALLLNLGPNSWAQQVSFQPPSTNSTSTPRSILIESAIVKLIDNVDVPAELPGVLSTVNFREGQMVKKGDEVAVINADELALRLTKAEIEARIAKATAQNDIDVRFAQKSLDVSSARVERSYQSNQRVPGVVPQSRLEELELEVHRDRLRVEQAGRDKQLSAMQVELAGADVELSKLLKSKSSVRSPLDGMVVAIAAHAGEWVEPGDAILKIVRIDRVKVEGYLPASAASQIRIGDSATAIVQQDWLAGLTFPGRVVFINPEANPVNSHVQIWVEIENKDLKLIPGLESTLTIEYSPDR